MKDKQLGAALAEVCEEKLLAKSTSLPADFVALSKTPKPTQ